MAKPTKTIWIITGEASGDQYGAELAQAIWRLQPETTIRGMGADHMRNAGIDIMVDSTDLGIIGVVEALKHLAFFIGLMTSLIRRAAEERPDAVVMIDYPGFNLRFAQRLKKLDIPVVYYISPQVWAWKKGRIKTIEACVERMLCIFPFEPKVYRNTRLDARFVGHPLLGALKPYTTNRQERDPNLVILLPGSRTNEYKRLIPVYMQTAMRLKAQHPELRFHLPLKNEKSIATVQAIVRETDPTFPMEELFSFSAGDTRAWLRKGAAGIAASGTVTVEATIIGLPVVVTYIVNPLTYWYISKVITLTTVTIANLVTGRTVFRELLQRDATPDQLSQALLEILPGGKRREETLALMNQCVTMLGAGQDVPRNVAQNVLEVASGKH